MISKNMFLLILSVLVVSLFPSVSSIEAKDIRSQYYDDATLGEWQPRYRQGITRNLDAAIWPRLTPQERRKLAAVQISFPLRSARNAPSDFYATSPPPMVNMPVLSLKFSHDMSIAIAWLQLNGYVIETVFEYLSMLKYKTADDLGGRYPPPLEALHIPDNAGQNSAVERLANKIFDSAIAFILLHEFGHHYWDHPGYRGVPRADARKHEAQADQFAIEIFRRMGMNPIGMALYFIASAHVVGTRADYRSDTAYEAGLEDETHPLTENRLQKIVNSVRTVALEYSRGAQDPIVEANVITGIANKLSKMVGFLGDRKLQRFIARIGATTTVSMLRPRRQGELAAPDLSVPLTASELIPFHGSYGGTIGLPDGFVSIKTFLQRQGNQVNGEYYYGAGRGILKGQIQGNILSFKWEEGPERGHGKFQAERDGAQFTGMWGFGQSHRNGGRWSGIRQCRWCKGKKLNVRPEWVR